MQSNQRQIIEQAKFTYFPLGKAKEKKKQQKNRLTLERYFILF